MQAAANVSPEEIARFGKLAARWWDPDGESRPLHDLNPVRAAYVAARVDLRRRQGGGCRLRRWPAQRGPGARRRPCHRHRSRREGHRDCAPAFARVATRSARPACRLSRAVVGRTGCGGAGKLRRGVLHGIDRARARPGRPGQRSCTHAEAGRRGCSCPRSIARRSPLARPFSVRNTSCACCRAARTITRSS